jgi:hypothetical protein
MYTVSTHVAKWLHVHISVDAYRSVCACLQFMTASMACKQSDTRECQPYRHVPFVQQPQPLRAHHWQAHEIVRAAAAALSAGRLRRASG